VVLLHFQTELFGVEIKLIALMDEYFGRISPQISEFIKGSLTAFLLRAFGAVLVFSVNAYVARSLGVNNSGVYFLSVTLTAIIIHICRFGLDNSIVRFIAAYSSTGKWALVKGVFAESFIITIAGAVLLATAWYKLIPYFSIDVFKKPELIIPLRAMVIFILPSALIVLIAEAFRGLKKIGRTAFLQNIFVPMFVLVGFLLTGISDNISHIIKLYVIGFYCGVFVAMFLWRQATPELKSVSPEYITSKLVKTSLPLFSVNIMYILTLWTSTIVMGMYYGNAQVGIYNVAVRTANLMSFVIVSINAIAAPVFAGLYHQNKFDQLKMTAQKLTSIMTVLTFPLLILLIIFAGNIMSIFGSQFSEGGSALIILVIGYYVNVTTGPVGILLMMSGNEKLMRNNLILITLLNIILSFILIPKYGIVGAAITSTITMVVQHTISMTMVRFKLKFWTMRLADIVESKL